MSTFKLFAAGSLAAVAFTFYGVYAGTVNEEPEHVAVALVIVLAVFGAVLYVRERFEPARARFMKRIRQRLDRQ